MFWITVGHASRHTARAIGPSTIERSKLAWGGAASAGGAALAETSAAAVAAVAAAAVEAGADSMSDLTTAVRRMFHSGAVSESEAPLEPRATGSDIP